ncbi:MAG: Tim44 domain-containing protein [Piscinibacter sp.]|nr:Tim44 domain-containing protein [Piscinibacter sp.]
MRRVREAPRAATGEQALLAMARDRFVALQAAWDQADVEALRALTTDGMLDELLAQLPERGDGPNRTDVLALEARLLAHDRLGAIELASFEFSGVVRESPERCATPFREIWMLARDAGEQDWRLARQQALL